MSNKNVYDAELMNAMREEERFMQDRSRTDRRVKIERGHVWKVRFLPAHLGEKNTWFARVAKHWLNKKPIVCPTDTGVGFGGDPEAYCPCCRVSSELNDSPDERISRLGWETRANSQWITFCIVLEKDGEEVSGPELLMPYEFAHYSTTWEELKLFWRGGTKGGKSLTSVLDYKTGCDFNVTRTGKGMKLDKDDPRPIFDLDDPQYDSYIEKIESGIKMPKIHIPTAKELEVFAEKMQEESERMLRSDRGDRGDRGGPSRSRRAVSDEELEGEDDRPAPRASRPLPRRSAPADEDMGQTEEDDSNPELNPLPPKKRPVQAEDDDAPPPRRRPAAEPEADDEPTPPKRRAAPEPEPEPEDEPTPPKRRAAPAAEEAEGEEAAEEDEPTPPPRKTAPPLPKGIASKKASVIDKIEDDPEELPEEQNDQAPPKTKPVSKLTEAEGDDDDGDAAPPPTTRKLGGGSIRDKIGQMSKRE